MSVFAPVSLPAKEVSFGKLSVRDLYFVNQTRIVHRGAEEVGGLLTAESVMHPQISQIVQGNKQKAFSGDQK